jgi:hypothetical protein
MQHLRCKWSPMNLSLITAFGVIILLIVLSAGLGSGVIRVSAGLDSERLKELFGPPENTVITPGGDINIDSVPGLATTSTTLKLRTLLVTYSPKKLYLGDDAQLNILSEDVSLKGASIYLDGAFIYQTQDDNYPLMGLEGGDHMVMVTINGFENATILLKVDKNTYGASEDVKKELTSTERNRVISQGKADLRLYETAACVNCKIMADRIAPLVDKNRGCLEYERLGYWANADELSREFKPTDELPDIIIEGKKGRLKANGIVDLQELKEDIRQVSECHIQ